MATPGSRVLFHRCDDHTAATGHDVLAKMEVARWLADLLEVDFGGELDPSRKGHTDTDAYIVPSDTLTSTEQATRLGIREETQLFGGVVPYPFVATKLITHSLLHADADAPTGWSPDFGNTVKNVVLPGFSVFTSADAMQAVGQLLADGPVRVKAPGGVGGAGQFVVDDAKALQHRLADVDPKVLRQEGLVLERNLVKVATHSVGQVQVGPWLAAYVGTQGVTRNHRGDEVYGGSTLHVIRGGFHHLLRIGLAPEAHIAVEQALVYHRAAMSCFPGLFASRCNYDVAQGLDDAGQRRSGVLEQSWRIGGASAAEIVALQAFRDDPTLNAVRVATHEVYGEGATVPAGARVHFEGVDPHVGRILKYAQMLPHGHA